MFTGPPRPLPPEFPLRQLITLIHSRRAVGVWLRESGQQHRLTITAAGRSVSVLIGEDLGALLRSCGQVLVREGAEPRLLDADALLRWRALQVATATPYLPRLERLKEIFPGVRLSDEGFDVPLSDCAPEEVLADCLTHEIPVAESRVIYRAPNPGPALGSLYH